MNKLLIIGMCIICLFSAPGALAQGNPGREKIKSLKIAFITERLNLTTAEAQQFWPIYNDHEAGIEGIKRKENIEIRQRFGNFDALSDREASDLLDALIGLEKEKHQLNVNFMERVSGVLGARKTMLLIKAEEDFKRRLLREMQARKRRN